MIAALRHVCQARHLRTRGGAIGGILPDVWPKRAAPYMEPGRSEAGRVTIAPTHRFALDLIRRQQCRPAPTLHRAGELPCEIDRVSYAGVHAQSAGGHDQDNGNAPEEPTPPAVA